MEPAAQPPASTQARGVAGSTLRRIAKNAAVPMAASLVNKLLDLGFVVVLGHTLTPTELGRYTWAVLVVGYFDILINFGLGVLITRDVARDPQAADRYLGSALMVRTLLWLASIVVALAIAGPLVNPLGITSDMALALAVLTLGIGISNLTGVASALFNARELMEYPAAVTVFTTVLKVVFGTVALVAGFGIVGLATVSVVVNLVTGCALLGLLVAVLGRPRPVVVRAASLHMVATAYPLMINNLLATLFFRVDGLILRAVAGDAVLGWYGMAYKFIDGLSVIPSSFVLALFPLLSRMAGQARDRDLVRATELALKVLISLALPIAMGTTLVAEPIIGLFTGDRYLPHSAIALQLLIWFVPFSFTNALLQYVLIAVDQQRFITISFLLAATFNIVANLLVVPQLSYVGAAITTVLSEVVLLVPFWFAVRRYVGRVRIFPFVWRPGLATLVMAPVAWAIVGTPIPLLAIPVGGCVYGLALLALGGVTSEERALFRAAIGARAGPSTFVLDRGDRAI